MRKRETGEASPLFIQNGGHADDVRIQHCPKAEKYLP